MEKPKKNLLSKLSSKVSTHKNLTVLIGVAILAVCLGALALFYAINQPSTPNSSNYNTGDNVNTEQPKAIYYSPLSGVEVANEVATKNAVTAIMIENSPDARPQSGLKDSEVVFESIAEGGITRFLALYQNNKPQLIGPVRSVRMYYVDWLAPFNASIAHIGGSASALAELRNGNYRDIDQFFNSSYYWRSSDRYAPHNVYTSFEKLDALNASKGYSSSTFEGFKRGDSNPIIPPAATGISVEMSYYLFNSSYSYDPSTNSYLRFQAGEPHKDREMGQISPKVVAIIKVPMTLVLEDGYRQAYQTIGSGQAYIFQNGTVKEATWSKSNKNSQIRFLDANGVDIELARGQTWISAIPADSGSVSWQ